MITQEQMSELKRICNDLQTQNNRCTADPVFVVFGKDQIAADEDRDHDGYWYYNSDQCENANDEEVAAFDVLVKKGIPLPKGWERVAYKEIDVFQAAFLTENGAKAYLMANGHNIKKPFIYAHSFYRNREMLTIRACLQDLVNAAEKEALQIEKAVQP